MRCDSPGGLPAQHRGPSSGRIAPFTAVTMAAHEDATSKGYQSPIYALQMWDTKVSVHV